MFTRRTMFGSIVGVAGAATLSGTALATNHAAFATDDRFAAARAHAACDRPFAFPDAHTVRASVGLCRSWDRQIYLYANAEVRGFAVVDVQTFALAVGAQGSNTTIAAQYWGYEPSWAGVGRFAGVLLAVDERDLPPLA